LYYQPVTFSARHSSEIRTFLSQFGGVVRLLKRVGVFLLLVERQCKPQNDHGIRIGGIRLHRIA
jgi:hypothetical protein